MIKKLGTVLLTASLILCGNPAFAAEVTGSWTDDSTRTLTESMGGIKARGWVSAYYNFRSNNANLGTAIPGRTYDVRDQSFVLELAEIELERVPEKGKGGFKLDLAFGEVQDQNQAGILATQGPGSLAAGERHIQHATVGFIADIGNGIRFDAGKMVTHIGYEYTEAIKNSNFSHSYLFTYGPFQQTGVRTNYKVNDHLTTELYVLNGWNSTIDNDKGKSIAPSILWNYGAFSGALNYMGGLESDHGVSPTIANGSILTGPGGCVYGVNCAIGSRSTMRHFVDTSMGFSSGDFNAGATFNYGTQKGIASPGSDPVLAPVAGGDGTRTVKWYGGALYARYKLTANHEPALRWETFVDPNNFMLGQANRTNGVNSMATRINSLTVTWNWKAAEHFLIRPEARVDRANRRSSLFTNAHGVPTTTMSTIGLSAISYF